MIGLWTKDWCEKQGLACLYQEEMTSTNELAKQNLSKFSFPYFVLCDYQKQGRGRGQNTWTPSSKGNALYLSICFRSCKAYPPINSARIGLLLYESLQTNFKQKFSVKAPNDIYLNNKKLAGLLLESVQSDWHYLIVGVGINVLDTPNMENAICLDQNISKEKWCAFLDTFWQKIKSSDLSEKQLKPYEQEELTTAVKNFDSKLQSLDAEGNLHYKDHTISWLEI
tara:strand:- start:6926 stop:7600 length:675 start_codon:yes stop_codon:yes gene_type:complete